MVYLSSVEPTKIRSKPVPLPKVDPSMVKSNPFPQNKVQPLGFKVFNTMKRVQK
jgi:hypothetical protein